MTHVRARMARRASTIDREDMIFFFGIDSGGRVEMASSDLVHDVSVSGRTKLGNPRSAQSAAAYVTHFVFYQTYFCLESLMGSIPNAFPRPTGSIAQCASRFK
jgi:hypothetical protein